LTTEDAAGVADSVSGTGGLLRKKLDSFIAIVGILTGGVPGLSAPLHLVDEQLSETLEGGNTAVPYELE
jgi:hypothetical protein